MATGYSIFSTELTINGTAIAKPVEQEIVIPPKGEDENGVDISPYSLLIYNYQKYVFKNERWVKVI